MSQYVLDQVIKLYLHNYCSSCEVLMSVSPASKVSKSVKSVKSVKGVNKEWLSQKPPFGLVTLIFCTVEEQICSRQQISLYCYHKWETSIRTLYRDPWFDNYYFLVCWLGCVWRDGLGSMAGVEEKYWEHLSSPTFFSLPSCFTTFDHHRKRPQREKGWSQPEQHHLYGSVRHKLGRLPQLLEHPCWMIMRTAMHCKNS